MPKTLVNCPQCRQPIQADVRQLFDFGTDPAAKQLLLSGGFNYIRCPLCGFQGNLATPVVYHDPEKELLLTFVPTELGLPQTEQEKVIGGLINRVVNNLPQEKRKGYLLRPQPALTMQSLVERVLEADGITREMLQAHQVRLALIQRLVSATEDVRAEIARQEDKQIDAEFFSLLTRLVQTSVAAGDEESAKKLVDLQKSLLTTTTFGQQVRIETEEVEAAMNSLKNAGKELTREKLLEIVHDAPNESRLRALVGLARPGMDYIFFQTLSERIEQSSSDEKKRLTELRECLLDLTAQVDKQVETRFKLAGQLLEKILKSEKIEETVTQALPAIDEFFVQALNTALEVASQQKDEGRLKKLQSISEVLQKVTAPPPEVALIEELLEAPDDLTRRRLLEEKKDQITPELLNTLANLAYQMQGEANAEAAEQVRALHRMALRYSMETSLKGS